MRIIIFNYMCDGLGLSIHFPAPLPKDENLFMPDPLLFAHQDVILIICFGGCEYISHKRWRKFLQLLCLKSIHRSPTIRCANLLDDGLFDQEPRRTIF
jgi:hypothetical protein